MKSLKIILSSLLFLLLGLPYLLLAAEPVNQQTCPKNLNLKDCQNWILKQAGGGKAGYGEYAETEKLYDKITESLLAEKVGKIIGMVLSVFGVVFLGLVVYSGFQWMSAGGNDEWVTKAKERIIRASIGLGIIVMAWALTKFIVTQMSANQTVAGPTGCASATTQEACAAIISHYCDWNGNANLCALTPDRIFACEGLLPDDCHPNNNLNCGLDNGQCKEAR